MDDVIKKIGDAVFTIQKRADNIQHPFLFTSILLLWLLIIAYTWHRQSYISKRRAQSVTIRNILIEIRKTFKQEQIAVELVKELLHKNMADPEQIKAKGPKTPELQKLRNIVSEMSNQLADLDVLLNRFDLGL